MGPKEVVFYKQLPKWICQTRKSRCVLCCVCVCMCVVKNNHIYNHTINLHPPNYFLCQMDPERLLDKLKKKTGRNSMWPAEEKNSFFFETREAKKKFIYYWPSTKNRKRKKAFIFLKKWVKTHFKENLPFFFFFRNF